jgi:hypothetical protein
VEGERGTTAFNCEEGGSGDYRRCEVGTLRCHPGASDTGVVLDMEATGVIWVSVVLMMTLQFKPEKEEDELPGGGGVLSEAGTKVKRFGK